MARKNDGLFKRNGIYYARVPNEITGKLEKKSSGTFDKFRAMEWRDRMMNARWDKDKLGKNIVEWTVSQLLEWAWDNEWSKRTWSDKRQFDAMIKAPIAVLGTVTANKLSVAQIEAYIEQRRKDVSVSTINRELAYFRSAFNQAIRKDGLLSRNPFSQIPIFNEAEHQRSINATEGQRCQLIENAEGTLKDVIEFAFETGLRKGEIEALTWDQIDWVKLQIRIVSRKGRRGSINVRFVPLSETALEVLVRRNSTNKYVFTNDQNDRIPAQGLIHAGFPRLTKRLGMDNFHFHDIRHTFGTTYYRITHNIAAAAMVLGHGNNVKTTMRYLNLSHEDLVPHGGLKLYQQRPKNVPSNLEVFEDFDEKAS